MDTEIADCTRNKEGRLLNTLSFLFGIIFSVIVWIACSSKPPPSSALIPFFGNYIGFFFASVFLGGVANGTAFNGRWWGCLGWFVGLYGTDLAIETSYPAEFAGPQIFPAIIVIPILLLSVFLPGCIIGQWLRKSLLWIVHPNGVRAFVEWVMDRRSKDQLDRSDQR